MVRLKYTNESYSSGSEFSLTSTKRVGELQFDKNSNMVVIYMSPHDGLNIAADEFKHAYQFETGQIGFKGNGVGYGYVVKGLDPEKEANARARLFGGVTTTNEWQGKIPPKEIYMKLSIFLNKQE